MTMTNEEILDIILEDGDGAKTIRQYFAYMASEVWVQGESFSGKYGMGNSDWQTDIYIALIKAGAVAGTVDDDGIIDDDFDYSEADDMLERAIMSIGKDDVRAKTKPRLVVFESQGGAVLAIDPSEVAAILYDFGRTKVYTRRGAVFAVDDPLKLAAEKLGFELVESVACNQK